MLKQSHGFYFPLMLRIGGLVLLCGGLGGMTWNVFHEEPAGAYIPWGIPVLLGLLLMLTRHGVMADLSRKRIRLYTAWFGLFPGGAWEPASKFPYVAVLRVYRGKQRDMKNPADYRFEVCLLSRDHRQRLQLSSHPTKDAAFDKGREVAKALGIELTTYTPPQTRYS